MENSESIQTTLANIPYSPSDFYEIMDMLDKRLNDKGKNWRHVLKSLKVLDYCLHEGSELVVTWARKNVYIIKTLREFQYIDEEGRDVGQSGLWSCLTRLILMLTRPSPCFCQRTHIPHPRRRSTPKRTFRSQAVEIPCDWS
jgi:hypothetical protein